MIARFYLVRFAMSIPFGVAVSLVASTLDLRRTVSLRKQMADHCLSASRALPVMGVGESALLLFVHFQFCNS